MTSEDVICTTVAAERLAFLPIGDGGIHAGCHGCPRLGRRWGCPPSPEEITIYRNFGFVTLIGLTVASDADLRRVRRAVESVLVDYETRFEGRANALPGDCPYCASESACTRPLGLPCRHPGKIRPSLEALGIDVCSAARGLLGREIEWNARSMFLVGAIFHDIHDLSKEEEAQLSSDVSSAVGRLASASRSRES